MKNQSEPSSRPWTRPYSHGHTSHESPCSPSSPPNFTGTRVSGSYKLAASAPAASHAAGAAGGATLSSGSPARASCSSRRSLCSAAAPLVAAEAAGGGRGGGRWALTREAVVEVGGRRASTRVSRGSRPCSLRSRITDLSAAACRSKSSTAASSCWIVAA